MTIQDTTKDPATKAAALRLLARGLISKSEAARLAGVSKQLVQHWTRDLDLDAARDATVARLWGRQMARIRSKTD